MGKSHASIDFPFSTDDRPPTLKRVGISVSGVLDGDALYDALCDSAYVDAITYSFSAMAGVQYRRIMVGTGHGPNNAIHVSGTHAKLYITYDKRDRPTAYIGSMNAVSPTLFELVVQLNQKQSKAMAEWFEEVWKLNNPNYAKCRKNTKTSH